MKKCYIIILIFLPHLIRAQDLKVTLLGTGVPTPSVSRFGAGILVEAGNSKFLFDCGRGISQRLWQLKLPIGKVDVLFLTHLHFDHTVGIPDFWLTGGMPTPYGQRKTRLKVFGPEGTKEMMEHIEKAFEWDTRSRSHDIIRNNSSLEMMVNDIKEGIVYDVDGIRVTAFLVDHADFINNAFGYRIDYEGHSIVISGDTRYNENLIKHAEGADMIIHEVAAANAESEKSPLAQLILNYHTSPENAGKVFNRIKPKLAVYSHIALLTTEPAIPPPSVKDLISRTRTTYNGPLEVGEDLMSFIIGDKIVVNRLIAENK
jgi:Metal-dependent hydrolases of the beta-lactamase superfamily III